MCKLMYLLNKWLESYKGADSHNNLIKLGQPCKIGYFMSVTQLG